MADLCSLADVKAWLQTGTAPFPPTDDRLLARLITSASDFVEAWLGKPISLDHWQEIRDGLGGEREGRMVLCVTPVINITGMAIRAGLGWRKIPQRPNFSPIVDLSAIDTGIQPTFSGFGFGQGYSFTPTEVYIDVPFQRGFQNVVIQYIGGYNPVPPGIQQATIELVARKYRERTRIGVKTINIGGIETITYDTVAFSMKDMGSDIQAMLWQYRSATPILWPTRIPPPVPALALEDAATGIVLEDDQTVITGEPG